MEQIAAGLISRNLFTHSFISNATTGQGTAWIIFYNFLFFHTLKCNSFGWVSCCCLTGRNLSWAVLMGNKFGNNVKQKDKVISKS